MWDMWDYNVSCGIAKHQIMTDCDVGVGTGTGVVAGVSLGVCVCV